MRGTVCARRRASSRRGFMSRSSRRAGDARDPRRRSTYPDSHVPPAAWNPTPAPIIAVIGIHARAPKAAAEMRDVMEAADVTEVSNAAETAMDGAGAVEAAMEGVS